MAFRMILRPMRSCAPIKGIGWRKYIQHLIWKYIAMFQVDFPTHIMMWPHGLVPEKSLPMDGGSPDEPPPDPPIAVDQILQGPRGPPRLQSYNPLQPCLQAEIHLEDL